MSTHLAAVSPAKGKPFELQLRPTPKPGPGELLIAVKSVALNPADTQMRDNGLFIPTYPTVIGFDLAGLVIEIGDNVPQSLFQPGITRVAAYAASMWRACDPDYGAFQERCLVPWQHAVPLPDEQVISWNQAATLPVSVQVPLNAWDVLGITNMGDVTKTSVSGSVHKFKNEAVLIWGGSSSVGSMGVQTARLLKENPDCPFAAVYAIAGSTNHEYVASLGADRVFDYKDPGVVDTIISAAQQDGLVIRHCFLATGQLSLCQAVLTAFLDKDQAGNPVQVSKIASAPIVPPDAKVVDGLETIFVLPAMTDDGMRLNQFKYWLGTWLRENLAEGKVKPSPEPTVVGKGLEAINAGLDRLREGVSCTKLVVEVSE